MMDFWNDKELMAIIRTYQQELKNAPDESFNHFHLFSIFLKNSLRLNNRMTALTPSCHSYPCKPGKIAVLHAEGIG